MVLVRIYHIRTNVEKLAFTEKAIIVILCFCGREVAKSVLIHFTHHSRFPSPVVRRTLDDTETVYPDIADAQGA